MYGMLPEESILQSMKIALTLEEGELEAAGVRIGGIDETIAPKVRSE